MGVHHLMSRLLGFYVIFLPGLLIQAGCRGFSFLTIEEKIPEFEEWNRLESCILQRNLDGKPTALPMRILGLEEPTTIKITIPMGLVRAAASTGITGLTYPSNRPHDNVSKAVLRGIRAGILEVRGTSVLIKTPKEKIALWLK